MLTKLPIATGFVGNPHFSSDSLLSNLKIVKHGLHICSGVTAAAAPSYYWSQNSCKLPEK